MTLKQYRRASTISLGDLTEPCKGCKQQTKLRDFVWVACLLQAVCRKCGSKYEPKVPQSTASKPVPTQPSSGLTKANEGSES